MKQGRSVFPQNVLTGGAHYFNADGVGPAGTSAVRNRRWFIKSRGPTVRSAGAFRAISQDLFAKKVEYNSTLSFTFGSVAVAGQPFRILTNANLKFQPAEVEVSGQDFGLFPRLVTRFDPGTVEVDSEGFRFLKSTILRFNSGNVRVESFGFNLEFIEIPGQGGNIHVTGSSFRFSRLTTLSFDPGSVEVSAPTLRFVYRPRLRFSPGTVQVSSPGFRMREALLRLKFTPGNVNVEASAFRLVPLIPRSLPDLRPTGREFKPPVFAFSQGYTEAGIQFKRLRASKSGLARLKLTYENIDSAQVESFLNTYDQVLGSYAPLILPAAVLSSVGGGLRSYMESPGALNEWTIENPPVVTSVQADSFNLVLELSSRIRENVNRLNRSTLAICARSVTDESGSYSIDPPVAPDCALANQTGC